MSASEQDSEGSNLESLQGTPYSSPLQQVPESHDTRKITYSDDNSLHSDDHGGKPHLVIVVQPQTQFRFRYKSERESGTHGCLQGESKTPELAKTYPTVQLKNFKGRAIIRCQIYQHHEPIEHPHTLHDEDQGDHEPSAEVPDGKSYTVCFQGLGIIHRAKKDVPDWLYKKLEKQMKKDEFKKFNKKKFREECKRKARAIDLNIVRLRFSAHDVNTDKELCEPEFSEPIYNMKSPQTNELKICYYTRCSGKPVGGDDVVFLVNKIQKGNIKINFFQETSDGTRCWETSVNLLDANVHHQYAIIFRTPPYKYVDIPENVEVFMEMQRTSDGRRSNRKKFTYVAEEKHKYMKRKKPNSSPTSMSSPAYSPASSIPSDVSCRSVYTPQIPIENEIFTQRNCETQTWQHCEQITQSFGTQTSQNFGLQTSPQATVSHMDLDFSDLGIKFNVPEETQQNTKHETVEEYIVVPCAIQDNMCGNNGNVNFENNLMNNNNPMLSQAQPNVIIPVNRNVMPMNQPAVITEDLGNVDINNFIENFDPQPYMDPHNLDDLEFPFKLPLQLHPDTGKPKQEEKHKIKKENADEDNVYMTKKESLELKKLSKEICKLKTEKPKGWDQEVKKKLERLFEIRLSNGDTFLHMTLMSHLPSLKYMISALQAVDMIPLVNSANDLQHTVLHLAVIHDMTDVVGYLVNKGCDPMCADKDGNTVIHHAVKCQATLSSLLEAMAKKGGKYDLDKFNREWQTPLHLAAEYGCAESVKLLLLHGASTRLPPDNHGRTALHIAVYDDRLTVVQTLLEFISTNEINMTDCKSMTPLQVACGGDVRPNTLAIIKLLLEKGANPTLNENSSKPAWKMAKRRPQMWAVMKEYLPSDQSDEDTTDNTSTSSDDEYESADEGILVPFEDDDITTKLETMKLEQQDMTSEIVYKCLHKS